VAQVVHVLDTLEVTDASAKGLYSMLLHLLHLLGADVWRLNSERVPSPPDVVLVMPVGDGGSENNLAFRLLQAW
jgi:hypothetical protein